MTTPGILLAFLCVFRLFSFYQTKWAGSERRSIHVVQLVARMAVSAADIAPKAFGSLVAEGGANEDVEDDLQVRSLFRVPTVLCCFPRFPFLGVYAVQALGNLQRFKPCVCVLAGNLEAC